MPAGEPARSGESVATSEPPAFAARIQQRYDMVKALQANGHGIREIARQLTVDRKTARRYTQAASADDLIAKTLDRDRRLDTHLDYLTQRWHEGCHDAATLHSELQQRGYRGSARTIYRHLKPLRSQTPAQTVPATAPAPPKIRQVTTWMLRRPEDLDDIERVALAAIRDTCLPLDRLAGHITTFAKMMVHRSGNENLDTWLAAVETDDISELHTFARGILQDYTAVRNGLSLPHNSGACEGNVGRLKFLSSSRGHCSPRLSQNAT